MWLCEVMKHEPYITMVIFVSLFLCLSISMYIIIFFSFALYRIILLCKSLSFSLSFWFLCLSFYLSFFLLSLSLFIFFFIFVFLFVFIFLFIFIFIIFFLVLFLFIFLILFYLALVLQFFQYLYNICFLVWHSTSLWFSVFFFFVSPRHVIVQFRSRSKRLAAASSVNDARTSRASTIHQPVAYNADKWSSRKGRQTENPNPRRRAERDCAEDPERCDGEDHWNNPTNVGLHFDRQSRPTDSCRDNVDLERYQAQLLGQGLHVQSFWRFGGKIR